MKPAYLLYLLLATSLFYLSSCSEEKGGVCLLTIDLAVVDIDTDTKEITATASGGTGVLEFEWFNGATIGHTAGVTVERISEIVGPGKYVFSVVDDAGCEAKDSITISFEATCPFMVEIIVTGETNVKTLTARARSGVPPYTYHWSNGSTDSSIVVNNPLGDFAVTVTDVLDCEVSATKNISPCPAVVFIDGTQYDVVSIGGQCWTVQNLRHPPAGIPLVYDDAVWSQLTTPAAAYYDNDENMGAVYGALFNGYAVLNGDLCPAGWRIPTDADWQTLIDHLGGDAFAGKPLKADSDRWLLSNEESNESGFSALPGGRRQADGSFIYEGSQAHYWSSTELMPGSDRMFYRGMFANAQNTFRTDWGKVHGFSCRCVKE